MTDTNQHYITKAYLDKFVHPSSGQEILYPYRKGGNPCKPRGIKSLGSAANFYRQRENGILHDKLDEARKVSETLLFASGKRNPSPLSQCIFEDAFIPKEADKLHLAGAAAFLWCGSPVQIHNCAMNTLLHSQIDLFNWHKTDEAIAAFREKHGDAAEQKLAESREMVLKGQLFADVGEGDRKQLGFRSFEIERDVISLLLGMQMTIVDCNRRCVFLTSDNPVVRTFPSGPGRADDEVWFPISHKRAVRWHRRHKMGVREQLGYSQCFQLNRRVIKFAHKFIYSPLRETWIEEAARGETYNPRFGHYGSLERVISKSAKVSSRDGKQGEIIDLIAAMRDGEQVDVVGV